ncbi:MULTISPECIES: WbuC family cupin fold metalloprotein [unclassified Alteromonas]|uniref:WbuC family cupin fold metalloprotein n=1 Tax=unclassified Alteromonas TaxID=2614992 RepID=UPI000AFDA6A2|nr:MULTISPECIES: WbuC family cupin fold metalloprotein [unclassified Alteromonas]
MKTVQLFDSKMFSELKDRASNSERRRANLNIHQSYNDVVQRLFIAMMPDSYVRPHRHVQAYKWEFFMVLEGALDLLFFDDQGVVIERVTLEPEGQCVGLEIPPNTWHATVCFEPVVFMEVKQGPYDVNEDKGFAPWAPEEGSMEVPEFLAKLKHTPTGTSILSE